MTSGDSLPRVVILYCNSGGGHRTAAISLAEALEGRAVVDFLNLFDDHTPFPLNRMSQAYGPWVNYAPWLYELVYRFGASRDRVVFTERAVYPLVQRQVASALVSTRPDLVISVHPLQVDVPIWILRAAGSRAPFVTVVTDPVSPPVAWFSPETDLCVVATEPARAAALSCGVAPERVQVIGLPVRRAFSSVRGLPRPEARAQLGLDAGRRLVLLTGGGAGIGKLMPMARAIAHRLAHHPERAQMAIIAGRNQALQRRLCAERWPSSVTVLGFVDRMADWLAATDLLITKAGPGTLAEAACVGVPVLITGFIPGQEDGNVAWVEQSGAGIYEHRPERIAELVRDLLRPDNPALDEMAVQAEAIAQPDASAQIAQISLSLLGRAGHK